MKFYDGNSLPQSVHSNCSVSDSPVATGPAQVPMPWRAGDGAFLLSGPGQRARQQGSREGPGCSPPPSSLVGFLAGASPTHVGDTVARSVVQVLWSRDHKVVEDLATVRAVQGQGAAGLLGTGQISVLASVSPVCVGSLFRGIREEVKAVCSWLRPYLQT